MERLVDLAIGETKDSAAKESLSIRNKFLNTTLKIAAVGSVLLSPNLGFENDLIDPEHEHILFTDEFISSEKKTSGDITTFYYIYDHESAPDYAKGIDVEEAFVSAANDLISYGAPFRVEKYELKEGEEMPENRCLTWKNDGISVISFEEKGGILGGICTGYDQHGKPQEIDTVLNLSLPTFPNGEPLYYGTSGAINEYDLKTIFLHELLHVIHGPEHLNCDPPPTPVLCSPIANGEQRELSQRDLENMPNELHRYSHPRPNNINFKTSVAAVSKE